MRAICFLLVALFVVGATVAEPLQRPPSTMLAHHHHRHEGATHAEMQRRFAAHQRATQPQWAAKLRRAVAQLGLAADVTATLEETLFQKICATVLPAIVAFGRNLTIPGESMKDFSFDTIYMAQFDIAAIAITFASPNQLALALDGLTLQIANTHMDLWVWVIAKITCSGSFQGGVNGATITITLDVSTDMATGKLTFANPVSSVSWGGGVNVDVDFPNFFCKTLVDIIEIFTGNIDRLIQNAIENDLPSKIGPLIENALNDAFTKIPIPFASQPTVTSDSISLTVDLIPTGGPQRPPSAQLATLSARALPPRDIALLVPAVAVNNLLLYEQQQGKMSANITIPASTFNTSSIQNLIPAAYALCPSCPFVVELNVVNAPTSAFNNDTVALSVVSMIFGINALNASSGAIIDLVDVTVNVTVMLENLAATSAANGSTTVTFSLGVANFGIGSFVSQIGPIDTSFLTTVIGLLLNIAVGAFNSDFKGIPVPDILTNMVLEVGGGAVNVGMNVNI